MIDSSSSRSSKINPITSDTLTLSQQLERISQQCEIQKSKHRNSNNNSNSHSSPRSSLTDKKDTKDALDALDAIINGLSKSTGSAATDNFQEKILKSEVELQLSDLIDDLTLKIEQDHNIELKSRGKCAVCECDIFGEVMHAMNKTYHPEHFTCVICSNELGGGTFVHKNEKFYCQSCHEEYFQPKCAKCNQPITEVYTTAMDKKWHLDCFQCQGCNRPFGDETFQEHKGDPYCNACYQDTIAPKCAKCKLPVISKYQFTNNQYWHAECFVCQTCSTSVATSVYFHENNPFCLKCYHKARGTICHACRSPLHGSNYIEVRGKKYHEEHFQCAYCLRKLDPVLFKSHNEKVYHINCYKKVFNVAAR